MLLQPRAWGEEVGELHLTVHYGDAAIVDFCLWEEDGMIDADAADQEVEE